MTTIHSLGEPCTGTQFADQPPNEDALSGVAVSVTELPRANDPVQSDFDIQALLAGPVSPCGELAMLPPPLPTACSVNIGRLSGCPAVCINVLVAVITEPVVVVASAVIVAVLGPFVRPTAVAKPF